MALTFFWRCEGTTLDGTHDYSAGDTTASVLGVGTELNATAAYSGSNGIYCPASVLSGYYFTAGTGSGIVPYASNPAAGEMSFGFWMNQATVTSAFNSIGPYFKSASTDSVFVKTATSGTLQLSITRAGPTDVQLRSIGTAMSNGAWYFAVCRIDFAGNRRSIEVYNESDMSLRQSASSETDFSTAVPTTLDDAFWAVQRSASIANICYYDLVMVSNYYEEPLQNYAKYTSYTQTLGTKYLTLSQAPGTGADEKIYMTWAPAE